MFKLADLLRQTPEMLNRRDRCPVDKTAYYSKAEARAAVKSVNTNQRTAMKVFRCDYCSRWHLGHSRRAGGTW